MASKANVNRKRIMRSAILSASMLSLIPLVGAMQSATATGEQAVVVPETQLMAAAQPVASVTASAVSTGVATTTQPAAAVAAPVAASTTATAATQTATTTQAAAKTAQGTTATQTTQATSYTRTKAS